MNEGLTHRLVTSFIDEFPQTRRIVVAFSGGLDSRVLLHLAKISRQYHLAAVEAVHIDHGLQHSSEHWALQCQTICDQENIRLTILEANLSPQKGQSIEAVARESRYMLFQSILKEHDILLLGQHADDQVETVLLQLLRGAGPSGLAAMPRKRMWEGNAVIRPLLSFDRTQLEIYAEKYELSWIEDPSNQDCRFDRNYLRHRVIPTLRERFPAIGKTFSRSASHCAQTVELIEELTSDLLGIVVGIESNQLHLDKLIEHSRALQLHLLRSWIKTNGFNAPQTRQIKQMQTDLIDSTSGYEAVVSTADYDVRKYQGMLYIGEKLHPIDSFQYKWIPEDTPLTIEPLNITITRESLCKEAGIKIPDDAVLIVKNREGGEKFRSNSKSVNKSLKKIFQEHKVPPWLRRNYYLIFIRDELIAVPGLVIQDKYKI